MSVIKEQIDFEMCKYIGVRTNLVPRHEALWPPSDQGNTGVSVKTENKIHKTVFCSVEKKLFVSYVLHEILFFLY